MVNQVKNHILEIKGLYQEVIVNFVDLCEKLYLVTPLEMETLFNYMLLHGYLSSQKKFSNTKELVVDKKEINGANVLAGEGVCRHISPMFKDILVMYGYEAYNLVCTLNLGKFENGIWKYEDLSLKERMFGNHIICLVEDEKNSYFIDPMNFVNFDFIGKHLVDDGGRYAHIKLLLGFLVDELGAVKKLKARFRDLKPPMVKRARQETINNARKIIDGHLHLLDNFYQDNASLYDLVSSKLELIRK